MATSGSEVAKIHLIGDYLSSTWTLSDDGDGGTEIIDPTRAKAKATASIASAPDTIATHGLVQAMAGFGVASGAPVSVTADVWRAPTPALASPVSRVG